MFQKLLFLSSHLKKDSIILFNSTTLTIEKFASARVKVPFVHGEKIIENFSRFDPFTDLVSLGLLVSKISASLNSGEYLVDLKNLSDESVTLKPSHPIGTLLNYHSCLMNTEFSPLFDDLSIDNYCGPDYTQDIEDEMIMILIMS